MKITALLSWYDEPITQLHRAVTSLQGLADHLVAIDGPYAMLGDVSATSSPEQSAAIEHVAAITGIGLTLETGRAWAGEVEKRQALFDLAPPDSDWLIVIDADHEIIGSKRAFRIELANARPPVHAFDAVSYVPQPPADDTLLTPWHQWLAQTPHRRAFAFRALDDMRVDHHHWWYSGVHKRRRIALWGWDNTGNPDFDGIGQYRLCRHRMTRNVKVAHHCFQRSSERLELQRQFYETRDQHVAQVGVEA